MKITTEMIKSDIEELYNHSKNPGVDYLIEAYTMASYLLGVIFPQENKLTLCDVMDKYKGTKEYDGIIRTCQEWYYGTFIKDAWCCTWLSWCLAQMGLLKYTVGKKYENVYLMYSALLEGSRTGKCKSVSYSDMIRGDIIVFAFDKNFGITSSKHIGVYYGETNSEYIRCIGGNQDNSINTRWYKIDNVVGIFRPDYSKSTLKRLEDLPNA